MNGPTWDEDENSATSFDDIGDSNFSDEAFGVPEWMA
jgi:hypothetical protein